MPSFCAVVTCNDRYGRSENISFHKFPLKRLNLLKQWESFIQKQRGDDWHASRWSSLCSRHFREEDFRSLNERRTLKKSAVPSIFGDKGTVTNGTGKSKRKQQEKVVNAFEDTREKEFKEILAIKERLEDTVADVTSAANVPKTNCRLCGIASMPSANFLDNYELYGLLQKCFPTINIQQEDALPKVVCASCHNDLENFGTFVDRVLAVQTELQRKFRTKTVEKPVKIKQEPLVRVKQEVAESVIEGRINAKAFGGVNEDYDAAIDGGAHEEGDDQKYEAFDFPIINDCDIMEIINVDDPFINIPDDDNTTLQNEKEEIMDKPIQEQPLNYMPTAHELLQSHLLSEEHNYAYIDSDDFKEERQTYKTEISDNDERQMDYNTFTDSNQQQQQHHVIYSTDLCANVAEPNDANGLENTDLCNSKAFMFEKRALKPIVTSVSAIQQPTKSSSNGIVVLNESIVKSGCGFQIHPCMVCHLKFFSVENLKQHYTQTHGTPMVMMPGANISLERVTQNTCKMENEFTENNMENQSQACDAKTDEPVLNIEKGSRDVVEKNNVKETKEEEPENISVPKCLESESLPETEGDSRADNSRYSEEKNLNNDSHKPNNVVSIKSKKLKLRVPIKCRKFQNVSLNTMANQYHQLRKLYQRLQKKCTNLEQNVEQLQLMPTATTQKQAKAKSRNNKSNQMSLKMKTTTGLKYNENLANKVIKNKTSFTCTECSKSFCNSNSLRQHKITHTEERKHHCGLCQRVFKRRNGLLQHLKGYHLQVKPFSCPVCKHSYALKCDMLRCKHSILRNMQYVLKNVHK